MTKAGEIWTKLPGASVAVVGVMVNEMMSGGMAETVTEAMPFLPASAVEVAVIVVVPRRNALQEAGRVNRCNRGVARRPGNRGRDADVGDDRHSVLDLLVNGDREVRRRNGHRGNPRNRRHWLCDRDLVAAGRKAETDKTNHHNVTVKLKHLSP